MTGACPWCKTPVQLHDATVVLMDRFSSMLKARGEPPLALDEVVFCDPCRVKVDAHQRQQSEKRRGEAIDAAAQIRAGRNPYVSSDVLDSEWGDIVWAAKRAVKGAA